MNTKFRTVTTVAAGALALGFLTPSMASATSVEGYSSDVADAAVTSITSEQGITDVAAQRLLEVQQTSAQTLSQVTGTLGADLAGSYLDAQGGPVVAVTSQAAAAKAEQAGVTAKLVEHSAAQLQQARSTLDALPTVTHTSLGLDPASNQLVLTVADEADDAAAAKLVSAAKGLGDVVRVDEVAGGMSAAIYNGEAITGGGSRCSAGFNANKDGQDFIVDAGHCTGAVAEWNVGPSVEASFPENDYGLIQNTTGSAPGEVTLWDGSTQAINSAADATVGQEICKSGSTTNLTCGTVQAVDVTVNYPEGAVNELVQTSAAVNSGDSGGCMFAGDVGLGITSGMGGGSSFFQPVTEALSAYGVTLN
ncbi:S1 family peptidase [Prauserella cavernicola]|uniref:Alpha-lytic protease prodomain-containing protein n=1 Tax=Prauserella cavernicola TaxID=2800127 RepID=A0A934QPN3_9PSEU|nr:S1 family peptidase [Prauserella cavernicola]MBK1784080.1 alpha-lytic protease prodomain-containing protein [Prauserella cavernicola]